MTISILPKGGDHTGKITCGKVGSFEGDEDSKKRKKGTRSLAEGYNGGCTLRRKILSTENSIRMHRKPNNLLRNPVRLRNGVFKGWGGDLFNT